MHDQFFNRDIQSFHCEVKFAKSGLQFVSRVHVPTTYEDKSSPLRLISAKSDNESTTSGLKSANCIYETTIHRVKSENSEVKSAD